MLDPKVSAIRVRVQVCVPRPWPSIAPTSNSGRRAGRSTSTISLRASASWNSSPLFLLHLLGEALATKTLHRHRDHLWLLGGELIRRRYDDRKLKKMPVGKAIAELIEEEGGPLIWPRITEAEQNSFDATCRKLYKFLNSTPTLVR